MRSAEYRKENKVRKTAIALWKQNFGKLVAEGNSGAFAMAIGYDFGINAHLRGNRKRQWSEKRYRAAVGYEFGNEVVLIKYLV